MNKNKNRETRSGQQPMATEFPSNHSETFQIKKYFDRLSALAMIGKIAPEVIHDINNYLTVILGYAELLSMKKIEDESIKNGLRNIISSGEKCKMLLANILSLSRQESYLVQFGDVNEIIEKTVELRRCALRHRQIELVMDLENEIPALAINGIYLQKALLNMMFKAEEALEQRSEGRKIAIKTSFDSQKQTAAITISANGLGVPEDPLTRFVELFPSEESGDPGYGLELKEAWQWIKEMGGSLEILVKRGEGPVFEVLLPFKGKN